MNTTLSYSKLFKAPLDNMYGLNIEFHKQNKTNDVRGFGFSFGYNATKEIVRNISTYKGGQFNSWFLQTDYLIESKLVEPSDKFNLFYSFSAFYNNSFVKPIISIDPPVRTQNLGLGVGISPQCHFSIAKKTYLSLSVPILISVFDLEHENIDAIDMFEPFRTTRSSNFFSNYFISFRLGITLVNGKRKRGSRRR